MNLVQFLLTKLAEECNEVGQMALKSQQFGLGEVYTDKSNRERLHKEIDDMMASIEMLNDVGLDYKLNRDNIDNKKNKVIQDMGYSEDLSALGEGSCTEYGKILCGYSGSELTSHYEIVGFQVGGSSQTLTRCNSKGAAYELITAHGDWLSRRPIKTLYKSTLEFLAHKREWEHMSPEKALLSTPVDNLLVVKIEYNKGYVTKN